VLFDSYYARSGQFLFVMLIVLIVVLCGGMNPIPVTVAAHPRRSKPPSRFSIRYCAFPWCLAPAEFSSSRVVLTTPNSIFSRSLLPSPVPVHCSDFLPMLDPALLVLVVTLRFSFPPCVFVLRRVEFISGFCLPRVSSWFDFLYFTSASGQASDQRFAPWFAQSSHLCVLA
jgi:hypothetical protein